MNRPMDILREFPVRKSKKQKMQFREAVQRYAESLGYPVTVEKGGFGARNVVIGDPEKAKYVVTAHYDTCARLPFPNLITPCSFWLFLAYQLLLTLVLLIPPFVIGVGVGLLLGLPEVGGTIAYFLIILELYLMLAGPANPQNANDNTSGVVAVLDTAASLPQELRDRVCFVLFDLEEAGLIGSSAYRNKHKKATDHQLILNLDCVGEGDEILLFPTKKLKKNHSRLERYAGFLKYGNGKTMDLRTKGFSVYPSDQGNFPYGIGIASFCRSKWTGLYLAKIHTPKDINLDENNVALLRDHLVTVIREQA